MLRWFLSVVLVLIASPSVAADFQLSSPVIKEKGTIAESQVFSGMGCHGGNISPELHWQNAPKETKSFAVTVYDWVIFNIPATVHTLPSNAGKPGGGAALEESMQSTTDFGQHGYGGPCPPPGDKPHRYIFTVYALKTDQLPLKKDASGAMVGFYLKQNALAKATLTATYGR
jgi:Raf kinase inhibitor-like YbhB/YbcL family protein